MLITDYLVGIPSGQIIDINYKQINNLKQDGLVEYNGTLELYVFKDRNYDKILEILGKKPKNNLGIIIEFFQKQPKVLKYKINKDAINVHGSVCVENDDYTELPFSFGDISGDFIFKNCNLVTLKGSPKTVGGYFDVSHNFLIDLVDGPIHVGKSYDCSYNDLITLKGSPAIIKGDFNCSNNNLTELKNGPSKIFGFMDCTKNKLKANLDFEPECFHIIKYGKPLEEIKKVY